MARLFAVFSGLVLVGLTLAIACRPAAPPPMPTPEASLTLDQGLRLGVLLPTTGDLAALGRPMMDVLPELADTVNACGGVNRAPVTMILADSETNPAAGAAAMVTLTQERNVHGVIGALSSSVSMAAVDIAVEQQIPLVSPGSASPLFTDRARQGDFDGYWARTVPSATYQAAALAQLAIDQGYERMATVVMDTEEGVAIEQAVIAAFERLGGTVVNGETPARFNPNAITVAPEVFTAFGDNPEAVLAVLYAETGSRLLRLAHQRGLLTDVQLLLTDGVQTPSFPAAVGQTEEGDYILAGAMGITPTLGRRGDWLEPGSERDRPTGTLVPQTWDAGALLILAAQAAGTHNGPAIARALPAVAGGDGVEVTDVCEGLRLLREGQAINYQGWSGPVDLDDQGDVVGRYDLWTVTDDGAIAIIDTLGLD
jgi:neutral amino acid transport system substrate-binding protein